MFFIVFEQPRDFKRIFEAFFKVLAVLEKQTQITLFFILLVVQKWLLISGRL